MALLWLLGDEPAAAAAGAAAPAAELHVCPGGPPACDHATIRAAVDAANPGDVIKVATGVYTGVQARAGITQVVYISKTVTLRGGYTTADWDAADPEANPTTLDAQGLGRGLVISDTMTPLVEGLRITGGDATGLGGWFGDDAGGGVYVRMAGPTINNCVVYGNIASIADTGFGGGLHLQHSVATIVGSTIVSNTASAGARGYGGGICTERGHTTIVGNTIISNTASTTYFGYGGGLFLSSGDDTLQSNLVQGNIASTVDYGVGGGLALDNSSTTLEDNTFINNIASVGDRGYGGGLYSLGGDAALEGNTVVSNTATLAPATGQGGGLYGRNSSLILTNNLVACNHANTVGGGLWFGSELLGLTTSGRLLHTTIADNHGSGPGVYVGDYTTLALTNTIVAGHGVGITVTAGSTATLQGTLWYGNGTDTAGAGAILTGTLNLYGDPAFVNPAARDYHLGPGSPAIDAGVDAGVTEDIDGQARPADGGYDIGADEFWWKRLFPLVLRAYNPAERLLNPGFEGITCRPGSAPPERLDNWTHDTHDGQVYDHIFTPQGWVTWWRGGGDYGVPEVKTIPNVPPFTEPPRIRSGHYATLLFTFYRLQDMGLYQCVAGLEPGATVQFSAHAHGWSCDDSPGSVLGYSCGDPYNQSFQVGIEPNGIADPFAPGIVWNEKTYAPDHYRRIGPVSARVGADGRVCVFLRSRTKWIYKYGNAYWDDASLIVTAPAAPPSPPPPP